MTSTPRDGESNDFPNVLHWVQHAVLTGDPSSEAAAVAAHIKPNSRMSPGERFDIYRDDYLSRMVAAVIEDYPTCAAIVGYERFRAAFAAYVRSRPSRHPNINLYGDDFGAHLPGLLRSDGHSALTSTDEVRALRELAWLERDLVTVPMVEDGVAALSAERLAEVPGDAWERAKLKVRSSLLLVRLEWPVLECIDASRRGERPVLPTDREPNIAQVWRLGESVMRRRIDLDAARVLKSIQAGTPLAAALESVGDDEGAAGRAQAWFSAWIADGVFVGVEW